MVCNFKCCPCRYYCLHFLLSIGAQIIDLMMLVVDVVKGVQTQTAECLLIGELTCPCMVVVLNKIDLLPPNKRQSAIEKMTKRLHKTLESTRSVSKIWKIKGKWRGGFWKIRFRASHALLLSKNQPPFIHSTILFSAKWEIAYWYIINLSSKHEIHTQLLFLLARFKECPVIAVAAKPGGPEAPDTEEPYGVPELIEVKCGSPLVPLHC